MLTPEQLRQIASHPQIIRLWQDAEDAIIEDMARRISKTDFATVTAQWQAQKLKQIGIFQGDVLKRLSTTTKKTQKELAKLFNEAALTAVKNDNSLAVAAGIEKAISLEKNPLVQQIITAAYNQTMGTFVNLSRTTARSAAMQFENAMDSAMMMVESGGFDYSTAIRRTVLEFGQKGVSAITYPTGHTDNMDVAVRRALVTGVNQMSGRVSLSNAQALGTDLVEVTAHPGARPEHAAWQGQIFSVSGHHPKYKHFATVTGYGTGPGLCGWNCAHSFYPYFEGLSEPGYSEKMLSAWEKDKVTVNGKEISLYDARQMQREMERKIRESKRQFIAGQAANLDNGDMEKIAATLKKRREALQSISDQANLPNYGARHGVAGFGKSESAKAESLYKHYKKAEELAILEKEIKDASGIRGELSLRPKPIDLTGFAFDENHIKNERGRDITREQAEHFMYSAKACIVTWKGQYYNFYSENGAVFVDVENKNIRTAFTKDEFDDKTKVLMKELKKHGK